MREPSWRLMERPYQSGEPLGLRDFGIDVVPCQMECRRTESPERNLWIAVLLMAVNDLHSNNPGIRQRAEAWFVNRGPGFNSVCEMLGLRPGDCP